jgi:GH24 family phage-related lysozyme (muramidase)
MKAHVVALLFLASCSREQTIHATPTPSPTAYPTTTQVSGLVGLPPPPVLTKTGHDLIISFEGCDHHPDWPGGASGVTIGWGYDLGYYSRAVIGHDWYEISQDPRTRLQGVSGITGQRARGIIPSVRDIYIAQSIATSVFDNVDIAREFANAKRAMPAFADLRPNCQAALISLGFNRGWSFIGSNRTEMRDIRDAVPSRDYDRIALDLRKMERVWRGTSNERGLTRRREAEAKLVLTP